MLVQRVRTSTVDAADALHPAVSHVLEVKDAGIHVRHGLCVDRKILEPDTRHRQSARKPRPRTLTTSPVWRIESRSNPDGPRTSPRNRSHDHLLILRPSRPAIMRTSFLRTSPIGSGCLTDIDISRIARIVILIQNQQAADFQIADAPLAH